jgi:iron(III) transport system permease protein
MVLRSAKYSGFKAVAMVGSVYLALGVIVLLPIGQMMMKCFLKESMGHASFWTLGNFQQVLMSRGFFPALKNTLILSGEAVLLSTILGVLLAWLVARTDMPFKKILEPLNMIPFYLSSLVGALSWEVLAAPKSGILNALAERLLGLTSPLNIYSLTGMSLVLGFFYAPYVYLFTIGSFQNMDPSMEDAGRVSGASTLQTMMRITFPLVSPAILSACILVFVLTGSTFAVPLVLGSARRLHTISTLAWSYLQHYPPNYNAAAALSTILLIFTLLLILLQYKILGQRKFWTVTGKGFRPKLVSLGPWRWAAMGLNLVYLGVILLPLITLFFVSFVPGWTGKFDFKSFSLANYWEVLVVNQVTQRGLVNSTIVSTLGAMAGLAVSMLLAALIHRTRWPGRTGIDFIAMSPVAFPGIILGMGMLITWIRTPLYGTLWILGMAYVIHFLPTGLRSVSATLGSISPDLDECARICGTSWWGAVGRILVPLMWPGLMSTWLLFFVTFFREVGSSMMLYVNGTETVSIALIQIMDYGTQGASAALGVLLTVILLVAVYFFRKLTAMLKIRMENFQSLS